MATGMTVERRRAPGLAENPEDLLQRLVCFVASALDVRFAFLAGLSDARACEPTGRVSVWLAKDYGLRCAFGSTERPENLGADTRVYYEEVLRRLWPAEPDLVGLVPTSATALPLLDSRGRLLGHFGVLNPGPAHRLSEADHLKSLARVAASELERWFSRA
jgi:hypothetical protein